MMSLKGRYIIHMIWCTIQNRGECDGCLCFYEKLEDNAEKVVCEFGPNEGITGIIEFNKNTKQFKIVKRVSDVESTNATYERWAAEKIAKIMYRQGGVFPDVTAVEK